MANNNVFISHTADVYKALLQKGGVALEACGLKAEGFAVESCPVDTGNLKNSITHNVNESDLEVVIGTPVEYGIYVEYGTGIYAENGGGRKTPWKYVDSKGVGHITSGSRAQPFIKPALSEHVDLYKRIIENELKK